MKHSNKTLIIAALLSILINVIGIHELYNVQTLSMVPVKPEALPVTFEFRTPKKMYLDTPVDTQVDTPDQVSDSEFFSDKSSLADSSSLENETGILPESKIKGLLPQAERGANIKPMPLQKMLQKNQQNIKEIQEKEIMERNRSEISDKISVLKKSEISRKETKTQKPEKPVNLQEELEKLNDMDVSLTKPQKTFAEDLFPLPMISIGNKTLSELGIDAFSTQGSYLGKYVKKMREKIGLHFNQMIFFHYKSSYILETRANISFRIAPNGKLLKLKAKFLKGDPLFVEYCKSVITSSAPFSPFSDKMKPFLEEDGNLDMNIVFGYNVSPAN